MKDDFEIDNIVDEISRSINGPTSDDYENTWDSLPKIEYMEPDTARRERYDSRRSYNERTTGQKSYNKRPVKKRKKRHPFRKFISIILVLAIFLTGIFVLLGKQPVDNENGLSRMKGHSTVLVAGTDKAGYRTDTIMLVSLNLYRRDISLLSIPRDTYCDGYKTPKINAAVGVNGGGAEGMEALMQRVTEKIGFKPDGYVLIDLNSFIEIVDLMGGVKFNVPMDMKYDDPAQDLYIDLREGEQHLNGVQAMGLVRFRKGYAMADLTRVTVQRDFVKACMKQWISPKNIIKLPKAFMIVKKNILTDLSVRNMMWVLKALVIGNKSDMKMETLPGKPQTINGGSYFVLDNSEVAKLVRNGYTPYK